MHSKLHTPVLECDLHIQESIPTDSSHATLELEDAWSWSWETLGPGPRPREVRNQQSKVEAAFSLQHTRYQQGLFSLHANRGRLSARNTPDNVVPSQYRSIELHIQTTWSIVCIPRTDEEANQFLALTQARADQLSSSSSSQPG